jgi:hypothetical protein
MTAVDVVTASADDEDAVPDILRSAGTAGDVDGLPRSTRPGYRAASRYQRAING